MIFPCSIYPKYENRTDWDGIEEHQFIFIIAHTDLE